jgi:putative DNA primase/helicase
LNARPAIPPLVSAERAPAFSDEALALQFAERHAGDLRFVAAWNKWLIWEGTHWRFEETLRAWDFARRVCREAATQCNKGKTASAIASAKTVYAIERLAHSDRRLAATVDQWDADPWLLNTPDGAIDLRTGQARPHIPEDYFTKITAVGPRGDCPRFLTFLKRIAGGDSDLISYLQRVLGYGLTGLTREHALFFGYGTGANGKSVLLSTIAGILGEYHRTAPIETFTASNGDRHPTDLAGLRGARLVTATETEEGRRWAESRIKQLTGGDTVAARFMRQDFFEYRPAFKLIIAGNHKPSLRSVDEAIRRRFHLIPFAVTIPPKERVADLAEKLRDEWPGILAWLIEGCLEWQTEGLRPPNAVLEATEAYLSAEAPWQLGSMRRAPARREHGNRQRCYSRRGAIGQTPQANIQAASNAFPRPSNPGALLASARGAAAAILSPALTDYACFRSPNRRGTIDERRVCAGCAASVGYPLIRARARESV